MFSHLDKVLRWDQLTAVHQLNVLVDSMAKRALMKSLVNRNFIDPVYPFEEISLTCGCRKSIGSSATNINRWRDYKVARHFYAKKKLGARIHEADFDIVYWEVMGQLMR